MVWVVIYLMLGFIVAVQAAVELDRYKGPGEDRVSNGDFLRIILVWPLFIIALLWSVWAQR